MQKKCKNIVLGHTNPDSSKFMSACFLRKINLKNGCKYVWAVSGLRPALEFGSASKNSESYARRVVLNFKDQTSYEDESTSF